MNLSEVKSYINRLIAVYDKKEDKMFIKQYLQGSGNELKDKFWSRKSSSRLAFDLYSWMAVEQITVDFQFEKQLPGVVCKKSGPSGVPNMDVYFETEDEIVFIESKYTEKESTAYTNGENPHLSKAYWEKEEYGNMSITDRFYGRSDIAECFSNFIISIQQEIDKQKCPKWFYPKQETTHLFGIIFNLLKGRKDENGKFICDEEYMGNITNVYFYNIIWKMEGDDFENKNSLPYSFIEKADQLFKDIFGDTLRFYYKILVAQDLLNGSVYFHGYDFKNAKPFGLKDVSLYDHMMKQYKTDSKR